MEQGNADIDLKRIAADVSTQYGIRIDADDPMMAVVTINRLAFEQAVVAVLDRVDAKMREFEAAADKTQLRAGGLLAKEVRDGVLAVRQEQAKTFEELRRRERSLLKERGYPSMLRFVLTGLTLALGLIGVGIWVGIAIR